jgi:hypothetical protein
MALMVCCSSGLTNVVGRGTEVYQCQGFARVLHNPNVIDDLWSFDNVAIIHVAETAMPSRLACGR